jgi:protein-L-isoaspartate O-methyltransferase
MYAMIAEKLDFRPGDSFLNIGSGTGYFSALIAHLIVSALRSFFLLTYIVR